MLAENCDRIADGEASAEPTKPVGAAILEQPMQLARIHQYLSMAMPLLWLRQPDTIGVLGLALNACAERDGYPETTDRIGAAPRGGDGAVVDAPRDRERGRPDGRHAALATPDPYRRHRGVDRCLSCSSTAAATSSTPRPGRRWPKRCATRSASSARRSPATKGTAAPAPCSSTGSRPFRASPSHTASRGAR